MSDYHDNTALAARLKYLLHEARGHVSVPIGTLVDRHTVKVRSCGGHKADAVLAIALAIREVAESEPLFARMGRAIRHDGTIDLWIAHPEDRWRAAVFTFQIHRAFKSDDLMLMVSTYVPFGHDGDTSQYPVEQSTAYQRGTQDLRAVIGLEARRTIRSTEQSANARESGDTSRRATEHISRYGTEQSGSSSEKHGTTWSQSNETAHVQHPGVFGREWAGNEKTETQRNSNAGERTTEHSLESGWSREQEQSVNDSSESESSSRTTESSENETVTEVTQEISFVAVGTDFTDAERLWAAWRSDPANADIGTAVELVLSSVGSLGDIIAESVALSRREAREGREVIHGNSFSPEFWKAAQHLLPVDLDGSMWRREILAHDGYPAAITQPDIENALARAQQQIGTATESARRFLGGS